MGSICSWSVFLISRFHLHINWHSSFSRFFVLSFYNFFSNFHFFSNSYLWSLLDSFRGIILDFLFFTFIGACLLFLSSLSCFGLVHTFGLFFQTRKSIGVSLLLNLIFRNIEKSFVAIVSHFFLFEIFLRFIIWLLVRIIFPVVLSWIIVVVSTIVTSVFSTVIAASIVISFTHF